MIEESGRVDNTNLYRRQVLRRAILILFVSLTCLKLHAQRPVAGFTVGGANPQCAPAIFSLQDNSTGATSIFYRLGDGRNTPPISPGQLSGALYNNPGTYTITQIATNAFGSDSTQRTVTVSPSPRPEFSVDKGVQCFPLRATFTDLSDPLGTTITNWFWDFGDGNTSTQRNPQHIYRIDNIFRVTLIVTNSVGCTGTLNKDSFITVTPGVKAGFFNSFASSCKPPSVIDFFNTSTGPGTMTYTWRFGDGSPAVVGTNPSHVYNASGIYNVTLIASSSDGCTDSITNQVEIPNVNISSSINAPDTSCVNQPIIFTNVSTPPADSSGWRFGDGTEDTGPSVTKRYAAPGTYTVRLTNLFGGCLDSVVKRIVILDTPSVTFNSADTTNCRAPHTVRFTSNAPGAVSYQWDFGDGSPVSTQANPQKTYNALGLYTVTLSVTNRFGCVSRRTTRDFVKIATPVLRFRNLPDSGCVPLTINPTADIVAVDGVASYLWTFHDGTSTSPTPSKTYSTQGTYSVGLAITTGGGCLATIGLADAVKVGTRPTADFTAAPLNLCAGEPVNFTNLSTGNPTGYRWDFGDTANRTGNTSTLANPIYQYTDTGRFTVKLFVFNNGCADSAVKPAYIRAFGTVARFGFNVNCANKRQVSFLDSSINASSIQWNFGDGSPVTSVRNPVHTYAAFGDYNVTLTATQGTCTFILTKRVRVFNESASFTISPTTLCRGATTTLTSSAIDSNIFKYEWDWGNGVLDTGRRVFTYVYDTPRVYIARLAITDINGCTDTATRSIGVGGPRARFFAANPTGCVGLTVNFADSSLSDGANAIVSRVWDFGDGAIQTINSPPVSHQYNTTGFFNVKLRVTDAVGCTDSLVRNSFVVASSPRAAFSSPDTLSCPGKTVQFLTQASGAFNAGAHFWNFGDGRTSNFNNPQNVYTNAGRYDIRLRVTDRFGCSDSIVRTQYITIDTPFAAFDISNDVATCPPLIATFYNRSRYQVSQRWDFGDGDISVLPDSPVHVYNVPGTYVSRLVVTSPGGCTDTAFRNITIFGPNGVISASPTAGCRPLTVTMNVRTTNTDSVTWIYGDGTVEFGKDTVKTHTYTKGGDVILEVFLKDSTGCRVPVRYASPIRVIGITPGFDSDKKLLCDNGLVSFADTTRTNGAIQAWDWDFGDGTRGSGPTPTHFYNNTGFYDVKLRVTTEFGCTDSVTVPRYIKSVASPVAGIASADTACQNRFITYRGNILSPDTSAVRWDWNFANGNTSVLQNPPTQQYLVPGTFSVRLLVTNSSGCVDTVVKDIRIHPNPLVDAGADSTICRGQSLSLNATGASTYQWLPPNPGLSCTNCGNPIASPVSNITYRVRGTSPDGCQVDDSVRISVVQPSRVQAPPNDSLCMGQGMQLFATGTQLYRWSPATGLNNPNSASPIARPTATTTYVVTGSDARGCFVTTDSVTISVFPMPLFDLGPDVTIPVGNSVRFTPRASTDIVSVQWLPATGLSCTDCPDPVASPKQKTQYTATVVNNGGCIMTDQITVFVTCSGDNLFIPNTFSPNGDGMNDRFYPRGRGILEIKSIKIFSRWGQQVYWRNNIRANDASQGWDGTFKGVALSPDVYVYMIDVVCENNSVVTLKGDVMLVR